MNSTEELVAWQVCKIYNNAKSSSTKLSAKYFTFPFDDGYAISIIFFWYNNIHAREQNKKNKKKTTRTTTFVYEEALCVEIVMANAALEKDKEDDGREGINIVYRRNKNPTSY